MKTFNTEQMKINITSRDIKTFAFGIIFALAFVFIYDWTNNVNDVKEGYTEGKIDYEKSKH